MQRKPEGPPNRKVKNIDKDFLLIISTIAVFSFFMAVVIFSSVQCSNAAGVAQKHESEVISKCQLVTNSRYIDCLRREWDRIHNESGN